MSPVPSSGDDPLPAVPVSQIEAVEAVMAIHRATLARLLANGFTPLVAEFLEDAAATYRTLAAQMRGNLPS